MSNVKWPIVEWGYPKRRSSRECEDKTVFPRRTNGKSVFQHFHDSFHYVCKTQNRQIAAKISILGAYIS